MKHVFLVQHLHKMPRAGKEDVKIIGVYGSKSSARLAVRRAKGRAGFKDSPDGFSIDRYELDRDNWQNGFLTVVERKKEDPYC